MTPRYISRRYFRDASDYVLDFLDHEPNDHRKALPIRELPRLERGSVIYLSPKADQELFFATLRLQSRDEDFLPDTWVKPRRLQLRLGFYF